MSESLLVRSNDTTGTTPNVAGATSQDLKMKNQTQRRVFSDW